MNMKARDIAFGGMIAALYVVLTYVAQAMGLASGTIQVRFSEALCLLPCLFPAAVPGLFIGCVLANLLTGCALWDVIFGSLATLIGAVGTYMMRNKPLLSWIPPVLSNTIIVPIVLMKVYAVETAWPLLTLQIFAGEMISVCLLGLLVYRGAVQVKDRLHA